MTETNERRDERRFAIRIGRVAAWGVLAVVTGLLVRAEGPRPETELPAGVSVRRDLVYRRGERAARLDLYVAAAPAPRGGRPAVVAIHGGGWRGGSKSDYGPQFARLAAHGYVVAAVDYRLSRPGEPSWPANFEDVREAVRWLRRHAAEYGVDPNRIAALGASAGGHLAALLGTVPDAAPEGPDSARVGAVIDFYGPSDLTALDAESPRAGKSLGLFLGGRPDECPERYEAASPARHVSAGDPPMLLFHGADDRLVPPDQSRRLAEALRQAGVAHRLIVVPGARHGFGLATEDRDFLPEILAFLESAWNASPGIRPSGKNR